MKEILEKDSKTLEKAIELAPFEATNSVIIIKGLEKMKVIIGILKAIGVLLSIVV